MEANLKPRRWRGLALAEVLVGIGILAVTLLAFAAMTVQTIRSGNQSQHSYESACIAQNRLEAQLAQTIYALPLGTASTSTGQLQDETPYTIATEVYSVTDPIAVGLTDSDLRRVLVSISWIDAQGSHTRQVESCQARIPK